MTPIWKSVTDRLQMSVGQPGYDLWIRPLQASVEDGVCRVASPNEFHYNYVQRNFLTKIQLALETTAPGHRFELFVAPEALAGAEVTAEPPPEPTPMTERERPARPKHHPLLNAHYTFETFVVGTSNQVAHASAQSVSQTPGKAYNPLFLAGGAGLGKTHLLHGIGNAVFQTNPSIRIFCLSAEKFMNEYVSAIQRGRSIEFKDKYRTGCDLLLIDDVHTLQGREGTQEEFFHIFNNLHENGRQIVLTSDKYPKDMPGLEDRLRSRFEWGLIADIQPPEMETRVAIIRKKAEAQQLNLADDVTMFLATLPTSSVRDLEGHLTRLRAFSNFDGGRPIDLEFARSTLAGVMGHPKVVNVEDVIKKTADTYAVRVADIKGTCRKNSITEPRHVAMYITRELTELSFPEIGSRFGGRNHATVINACENVRKRMLTDAQFAALVNEIKRSLK